MFLLEAKMYKQKRMLIVWAFAIVFSVALSTSLTLSAVKHKKGPPKTLTAVSRDAGRSSSVAAACKGTLYPNACYTALSAIAGAPSTSPEKLFDVSVKFASDRARAARTAAYNMTVSANQKSAAYHSGIDDCVELLDITMEQLGDVMDAPAKSSGSSVIQTWLSAALTNQVTCMESLQHATSSKGRDSLNAQVRSLSEFISNSLALFNNVKPKKGGGSGRRLMSSREGRFPEWVNTGDRRLLDAASPKEVRADAVVAQDGSGTHRKIGEAIAFVLLSSSSSSSSSGGGRRVIYVKAGKYEERINIPTKQKNVMLMGDGKGRTVIVGSRNAKDGSTTYASATVAAMGAGFIAKGLTIVNNAGPEKHQAVALRVGADRSVVYECSIQGYQDTLYTHSNRQFYTATDIYGTVDFIFGNSAVVFQNCFIQPRRPGSGQKNSVTAQGRTDPNQNTGISIHKCRIQGASDLSGAPTYLGRPWKEHSRTVVMASYLDGSISSAGWEPWSGSFALSTLYYGEYANTGPGASTSGRVRWPGVHPSMSKSEASKFTVGEFIYGDSWLPGTGASYSSGL